MVLWSDQKQTDKYLNVYSYLGSCKVADRLLSEGYWRQLAIDWSKIV